MFVRYYVELSLPAAEVERVLVEAPAEWLSAVAGVAQARGDGLLGEVGVGPVGPRRGRRVRLELGAPVRVRSLTALPLAWEPVGGQGVLPRLDATLELGPLGQGRTQLASAPATTPLGRLGQAIDRVLLPRVAEATVKDFLDRLGAAVALSSPGSAARMPP